MGKLTALIEAAAQTASEPNSKPLRESFFTLANPATILELCALLEKAEEALHQARFCLPPVQAVIVREYLLAIKQWKEMK